MRLGEVFLGKNKKMSDNSKIWIVDFGSQYTLLITRKSRDLGYSCKIVTPKTAKGLIQRGDLPNALVLSGGPASVFEDKQDYSFLFKNPEIPILGICFGMHVIGQHFKGVVEKGVIGEYGPVKIHMVNNFGIEGCPPESNVWMSHSDHIIEAPLGFEVIMRTGNKIIGGILHQNLPIMGIQFHPEVEHTHYGKFFLKHFFENVAKVSQDWDSTKMLVQSEKLVQKVGNSYVLCAFSGGVDSLVAATLTQRIIGDRLHCFFVDNGLLRPQDLQHIKTLSRGTLNIEIIDAREQFYSACEGILDPESKRKAIGRTFIDVFEQKIIDFQKEYQIEFEYLLQGTLYPDVIESLSPHGKKGGSETIKSHHNVGGLPERMKLKLLEPLKFLFKDEVRVMGEELGLKQKWIWRHPFPGPGIGVRVLGELNRSSIKKVQESDQILFEELNHFSLYNSTWQAFTVFLPVKTVGVKGDSRSYENVICLRMVNSTDGMTAEWSDMPHSFLKKVSNRITNEVEGITRVVYDITSKPPGTIEWE